MCFTPVISLSTAILEFFVATFIFIYFKKSRVNFFFIIFLYFLGFYQFSEFMLCTSGSAFFWAKIGFVTYTFLPAIGLYSVLRIINRDYKSYKLALVYLLPIIFSLIAIIPALGIMFPSIYCEFAVLFAIAAVIAAYLDSKPRKRY